MRVEGVVGSIMYKPMRRKLLSPRGGSVYGAGVGSLESWGNASVVVVHQSCRLNSACVRSRTNSALKFFGGSMSLTRFGADGDDFADDKEAG